MIIVAILPLTSFPTNLVILLFANFLSFCTQPSSLTFGLRSFLGATRSFLGSPVSFGFLSVLVGLALAPFTLAACWLSNALAFLSAIAPFLGGFFPLNSDVSVTIQFAPFHW